MKIPLYAAGLPAPSLLEKRPFHQHGNEMKACLGPVGFELTDHGLHETTVVPTQSGQIQGPQIERKLLENNNSTC